MPFFRSSYRCLLLSALACLCMHAGQSTARAQSYPPERASSYVQPGTHMIVPMRTRDGLPGNFVYNALQDSDGYLWTTSIHGLTRYDGSEFEKYSSSTVEGWEHYDNVTQICEDRNGTLWFAANYQQMNEEAVYVLEMVDDQYRATRMLEANAASLRCMKDRRVLMIQGNQMILYESVDQKKEIPLPFSGDWNLMNIKILDEDEVLMATADSLLHYKEGQIRYAGPQRIRDSTEVRLQRIASAPGIDDMIKTEWGELLVITRTHVYTFSDSLLIPSYTREPGSRITHSMGVSDAWYNSGDSLYRITAQGVLSYPNEHNNVLHRGVSEVFNINGESFATWRISNFEERLYRLTSNGEWWSVGLEKYGVKVINTIIRDLENGLWVTTDQGLFHVVPRKMKVYTPYEGMADLQVPALTIDAEGSVWASVWGDGIQRLSENRWHYVTEKEGLLDNHVRSFLSEPDGTVWVGTLRGIVKMHHGEVIAAYPLHVRPPGQMYLNDILRDRQGRLWVASQRNLFELNRQGYAPVWPGVNVHITSLFEDNKGALWAAHFGSGVSVRNASGQWRRIEVPYVSEYPVQAIMQDDQDAYWFSTHGAGLVRMNQGEPFSYNMARGLPTDIIHFALDDGFGNFWLGSDLGIIRVSKQELDDVYRGHEEELETTVLSELEGLPGDELATGNSAYFQAEDGTLWFGTMGGLAVIDPLNIPVNDKRPLIHIQSFTVQGGSQPVESGQSFRTGPENTVAFEYATLTLRTTGPKSFKYRLLGENENWVPLSEDRVAFDRLAPGQYTFEVQGSNSDGIWSEEPARVTFTILPVFYQTWWFRGLIICLAIGVLTLWILQIHYKNRLNLIHQRKRIADDLHDDIGSKMGAVALSLDFISRKDQLTKRDREELSRQAMLTQELVGELRDSVWVIAPGQDSLSELIERMKLFTHSIAASLKFEFNHPQPVPDQVVDLEWRRNVYFLFKEAVHNAVRHARATTIRIQVAITDREMSLVVEDNGCGIERNARHSGRGLDIMKRRAKAAGGVLEIESKSGAGTSVKLIAPMP